MVKQLWRDGWKVLNTPITFPLADAAAGAAEAGKAVTELAKVIQENRTAEELAPLIGQMSSLLDVLNSPLVQVVGTGISPFIPLATGVLKYLYEQTRQEPSLEVGVAIVCQSAYLESIRVFLSEHPEIREKLSDKPASAGLSRRIRQVGEKLELNGKEFELTEKTARDALICFHESPLATIFNELLVSRFEESGLSEPEAERVTERISRGTHRYMKTIVAEVQDRVKRLAAVYGEGWLQDQETYASLDRYLEQWIATRPQEKVFDEDFSFSDIYVPLEVKPVDGEGKINDQAEPKNIETWGTQLLQDPQKQGHVLFIQGGPGRGKSVFCRMFADKVQRELHPIWTPILIRLRDVRNFGADFDKVLADAIGRDFTKNSGWITDSNTRFLFLLDGFDELLLERGATSGLQQFLDQVGQFQLNCSRNPERQHRVLITGRPLALFGIERLMPPNLERVEIMPMSTEIRQKWLTRWSALAGSENMQQFQAFLDNSKCPEQVKALSTEPLLLYLLAALHRDGKLQESQFEGDDPVAVKIQIYEAALEWVLTKQRSENGKDLNPKITGLDPGVLRSILAEAGLCVVQSGGESAPIAMIEERLKDDEDAKNLLEQARQQAEDNPLKNALAAFYLKSVEGSENQVEFFHKSFGEFLCAERLCESLKSWTERSGRRGKPFTVSEENLHREIYDLLGFGVLTQEVVEYLMGLLKKSDDVEWVDLFKRLEGFYLRWCDGEFIDSSEETFPQKQCRQFAKYKILTGQRQVDIATGLNTLILLLTLNRHAKLREDLKKVIEFFPCGRPHSEEFDATRLLRIIHFSNCTRGFDFREVSRKCFNRVNLSRANLSGVNLNAANFSRADLREADLSRASLFGANLFAADLSKTDFSRTDLFGANLGSANLFSTDLSSADLIRVNFSRANLTNANLSNANLLCANFRSADLKGANLKGANLKDANLNGANLSDIRWNSTTVWANSRGLHEALEVPEALMQKSNFRGALTLSRGLDWLLEGQIQEAIEAYQEAQETDPSLEIDSENWDALCWFGSLHNLSTAVLFAGDKAVMSNEDWLIYRDTRGFARALSGDLVGALKDFEIVVQRLGNSSHYGNVSRTLGGKTDRQMRQEWLEALQAGQNPITEEVLARLRKEAGLKERQ
jgi:uncharacterized protein YjbI with pentapeptide repeats